MYYEPETNQDQEKSTSSRKTSDVIAIVNIKQVPQKKESNMTVYPRKMRTPPPTMSGHLA
jgi:hypothetical protein